MKGVGRPRLLEPVTNIHVHLNSSLVRKVRKICTEKGLHFRNALEEAMIEYIAKDAYEKMAKRRQ